MMELNEAHTAVLCFLGRGRGLKIQFGEGNKIIIRYSLFKQL